MADIDVSSPGDTDVVANYPANERASRAALLALLNGTGTWGGTSGGSANAQTVTVSNAGWTLTSGATVDFIAGFANSTTTPTLQVNSTTAKTIVSKTNAALVAGDIVSGRLHSVRYDGTSWRLLDPAISNAPVGMSQTVYDHLFPIGAVIFAEDTDTPTVPTGVTATWTRDTTASYIRVASGTPGSGGSLNTSSVALTTGQGTVDHGVSGEGSTQVADDSHTHSISAHSHTIEPTYTSLCKWDRTA
jgi:hypothetical protein